MLSPIKYGSASVVEELITPFPILGIVVEHTKTDRFLGQAYIRRKGRQANQNQSLNKIVSFYFMPTTILIQYTSISVDNH